MDGFKRKNTAFCSAWDLIGRYRWKNHNMKLKSRRYARRKLNHKGEE